MSLKNTGMLYLLVYLKRYKQNQEKLAPLYLRISYNGQRAEIALKRFVSPDSWDNKKQAVKGRNQDAHSINEQIRVFKRRIYDEYSKLLDKGEFISTHKIKEAVLGLNTASKSLLYAFDFHNKRMETQIGKSYSKGTLDRFITCKRLVVEFLEKTYKKSDISLQEIDSAFIAEFDYFLRTVRNCNNNTTVKYVTNLRKVVRMAIDFGWLQIDPFKSYKAKLEEVTKEILTETELEKLHSKQFSIKRLEYVRDVFLFCCYTGLAYADVKKLSKEHIYIGIDKNNWIQVNRTKTKVLSKIPILPIAQLILDKYENSPECIAIGKLLPVLSNQKYNAYLKEIADCCGINKCLTSHMARHTFATTITLNNKVPIETVSKMLGHRTIRTTQHYSKVLDVKLAEDMSQLMNKYDEKLKIAN